MGKYIDAEKLKAEVEKRLENIKAYCLNPNHDKRYDVVPEQLAYILDIIDSLQQEHPEVDLEKAARYVYESWMGGTMDDVRRDMVELGNVLDARREEGK